MSLLDRIRRRNARNAPPRDEDADDAPAPEELVPQGGRWRGLLFDNPSIGLEPSLTWGFDFELGEVSRDYGDSSVSLTVEWVPLPGADWRAMAGHSASCDVFAEPIECSAYFFEHHRYDAVEVRVLEQQGSRLRVAVTARGDIDGLGIDDWALDQWLDFEGILVALSDTDTVDEAAATLAKYTDTSGLVGAESAHAFQFVERFSPVQ